MIRMVRATRHLVVRPQADGRLSRTFHGGLPSRWRDKERHARQGSHADGNSTSSSEDLLPSADGHTNAGEYEA